MPGIVAVTVAVLAVACAAGTTSSSGPGTAAPGTSGPVTGASPTTGAATGISGSTSGSNKAGDSPATAAAPTTVGPAATAGSPGSDWATLPPAGAGFDEGRLDAIATRAEAAGSNCLLVARHGEIVYERYWKQTTPDTPQEVFSATKSYASTLVGIAQDEGRLRITDKASTYIPEWAGTASAEVTIQDLLSNDSGRHWDARTDYVQMAAGARDKTAFAIGLGQDAPPGTTWAYNNSAIQTLSAVLKRATGEDPSAYAKERLLDPIGMSHSVLKKDASGGTLTFMGLSSTCRDMARFGHLMLRKGTWDGRQVVSPGWVDAATGRSSQPLNAAYGYLWWLNRKGPIAGPLQATTGQAGGDEANGQLVPGAPDDMFFALGLGNQIIAVDPGSDTVIVRLGPGRPPAGAAPFTTKDAADVVTDALRR